MPDYVRAICQEMSLVRSHFDPAPVIDSVFFGGGTPSLLNPEYFEQILGELKKNYPLLPGAEITTEANPGTVSREYIQALARLGINRISFGMQSANPQDLVILNRQHLYKDVVNAVRWSNEAGIQHINLDMIFGIPGQSLASWAKTLELASNFRIDHLSLYSLIIEEGTPFKRWYDRGLLPEIDEDTVAEMYELAEDFLAGKGYQQYEISNWALKREEGLDARCQHNLHTWQYHPYLGFGAGASGFIGSTRTTNVKLIPTYIQKVQLGKGLWPAAESLAELDLWEQMQETLMIGLRLTAEGVSERAFQQRFGHSMTEVFDRQLGYLQKYGLLERVEGEERRIRLTRQGRLLGNRAFMEFVGNEKPAGIA